MAKVLEAGKAKVILAFIVVGVLAVGGTLIIVLNYTDSQAPDDPGPTKADYTPAEVISEADDPIPAVNKVETEEEEEKPVLIRTVDGNGNVTWIDTRKVDIHRPGKGSIKAMKIASSTGQRLREIEIEPVPDKALIHPSQNRKRPKRKINTQGTTDGSGSGGAVKKSGSSKNEGKLDEGKGAGSGGG